jgi:histidine triad (HIT) family protein
VPGPDDCFICAKHRDLERVPGGAIFADEHALVTHLALETPTGTADSVYLGYLFVEPRRHVAGLGDLTLEEAASVGRLVARAGAALQRGAGAEHVYAAVIGHGIEHLHVHVLPRYPGTPREYWWVRVDEWPEAPRGGPAEVEALCERLRAAAGG